MNSLWYHSLMRLFIALDLSKEAKKYIKERQNELFKILDDKGRRVSMENFHITLAFLGEVDERMLFHIKRSLDDISHEPFDIEILALARYFSRDKKKRTYFLPIERSEELESLAWKISESLKRNGISFDQKPFRAHITLFRNAYAKEDIAEDQSFKEHIDSVTIFLSESAKGGMVYTPLYVKSLIKDPV